MKKSLQDRAERIIENLVCKFILTRGGSKDVADWIQITTKDITICKEVYPNKFIAIGEYWYYCPNIITEPFFLIVSKDGVYPITIEDFKCNIKSLDRAVSMAKVILKELEEY